MSIQSDEALLSHLAQFFKALADENRLKILGLVTEQAMRVSDLARELDLTEPTVSHHISKLREVGLLNLGQQGTNHYYLINDATVSMILGHLENLNQVVRRTPKPRPDMSWVDGLPLDEFDRKVLRDYCDGERLKQIPGQFKKLLAVLRWLATRFEPGRRYSEPEVNAILQQVHPDYASLRRELIEQHLLRRTGGGGEYWRE